MINCRACGVPVEAFMSFGQQPIANGYLSPEAKDAIANEYFYEMAVGVCSSCTLFQLIDQPAPERMFHENYAFYSHSSKGMQAHFEGFANKVIANYLGKEDPFVVEIGSNDGILLKHFAKKGIRHLGIEPSKNVADEAIKSGIDTACLFFGEDTVGALCDAHGLADVILSANVICHIPDIQSVAKGVKKMLKSGGFFLFEDPYLGAVLEKASYDQIYDEHVFLFSATSVRNLFAPHGLELIDVDPQSTHGGSMRYILGHAGQHAPSKDLQDRLQWEEQQGFYQAETYRVFAKNCEKQREKLVALLKKLKQSGKVVAGYAATAKSSTILNYCNIGPELIDYISDTTPIKQGKLSPGMHIPIRPHDDFVASYPDYAVLFAWNHRAEVMAKEAGFEESGGKWVAFVPDVKVE